jgi:enediyne biosynthesis protein E4
MTDQGQIQLDQNAGRPRRGNQGLIRSRRSWVLLRLMAGVVVLIGTAWTLLCWRHQSALDQVDRDIAAKRYGTARQRLIGLATRWVGPDAVDYRLGVCEGYLGHDEAALAAWGRLPMGSPFAEAAALNSAAVEMNRGSFSSAEAILEVALRHPGPQVVTVGQLLGQLYSKEGRTCERRAVLESSWRIASRPGWPRPDEALGLLRDHMAVDFVSLAVDSYRTLLDHAGREAPLDDRVWLGLANLAIRDGQFTAARRRIDDCLVRRPEDPAIWQAELDWGLGTEQLASVRRALAHLPAERFSRSAVEALRAWLASRRHDTETEQCALDQLLQDEPGECPALERLAVLATQAGLLERADQLRRRKADMGVARQRYVDLYNQNQFAENAPELARLAETLGRRFEAVGFLTWITLRDPANQAARSALARLQVKDTRPGAPGQTLAQVLVADLARDADRAEAIAEPADLVAPQFRDDAQVAGLSFDYQNGESSLHQLPEFTGGGVGLIDYDGDGWLDVYLVQGGQFPPDPAHPPRGDRLYRNRGDGTFEDVTDASGIGGMTQGFGQGVAVGDYDNDGRPDLFVTRWRSYALYRNQGKGRWEDVTRQVGLSGDRDWPTSAAFADIDNDGDLDLYVCHYVVWDAGNPRICYTFPPNQVVIGCNPRELEACPDHIFRNDKGRFTDVTAATTVTEHEGRGLGVVAADFDDDGDIDVFVANDQSSNYLYINRGGFRLEEAAQAAGVAANAEGGYQAGMGVASGDLDGDGRLDVAVTNFYGESTTFFRNLGQGNFADETAHVGLAAPTRHRLGFGIAFLDVDNDGRLDLLTANGHVNDYRPSIPYMMPIQVLQGGASGRLRDVSDLAGPPFVPLHLGRGLAAGDLDNDGRMDALVVVQNEPLVFLHNRSPRGHFVTLGLEGTASNRDGVGARVALVAGSKRHVAQRIGGGSYLSAGDPRLHFGLGDARRIESLEVRWPSGRVDRFLDLPADTGYLLREGETKVRALRGWR